MILFKQYLRSSSSSALDMETMKRRSGTKSKYSRMPKRNWGQRGNEDDNKDRKEKKKKKRKGDAGDK